MTTSEVLGSDVYTWVILPLLIFSARIVDVSLGTIRVILVSRGIKLLSAVFGFFEILIWLLAIGQIMRNLNSVGCYLAYAGGFATGTLVGTWLADRLAVGYTLLRIVTREDCSALIRALQSSGHGVTSIDAHGGRDEGKIIFTVIPRGDVRETVETVKRFNPRAFYCLEDVRDVNGGVFPPRKSRLPEQMVNLWRPHRKEK